MHSYTLNNWDGSQSQNQAEKNTAQQTKNNLKHALSREHVQSAFSATSGPVSTKGAGRTNDASYGSQEDGSHDWIKSEELEDKGLLMMNGSNNSHDGTSGRGDQGTSGLAAVISRAYDFPALRFQSQLPPAGSTLNDQAQDQATLLYPLPTPEKLTSSGSATRFETSTRSTYSRSILRHDQSLLNGGLNLAHLPVPNSQNWFILPTPTPPDSVQTPDLSVPQVRQSTTEIANGRGVEYPITRQMPPVVSDVTPTSIPSRIPPSKEAQSSTSPLARLNNGRVIKATVKTVFGTPIFESLQSLPNHQPTQPLSTSSINTNTAMETTKTHSKVSSQVHLAPTTKQSDKFTPITSPPASLFQPSALSHHFSRSKLLVPPLTHDLPLQQIIPSSVSASPNPSSGLHDHDDDCTSADADGESVDNLELDTLGLSQATTSIRTTSPSPHPPPINPPTQSNATINYLSNHVPPVYDLFTPPPTRLPSEISSKRKPSRPSTYLAYVEIPPLPPGKRMSDYRPFKGDKYLGWRKDRKEEPVEYGLSEKRRAYLEKREKRREKRETDMQIHGVRKKRRKKETEATEATRTKPPLAPASPMVSVISSGYMTRQQRRRQRESTLLASPTREMPSERVPSVGNLVAGASTPRLKPTSSTPVLSVSSHSNPSSVPSPPPDQSELRLDPVTTPISGASGSIIHPTPSQLFPSDAVATSDRPLQEPEVQDLLVHTAEHSPPVVTYFHTRFIQNRLRDSSDEWTVLGMQVSNKCVKRYGSIWDGPLSISGSEGGEGEEGKGVEFGVGGTMLWGGCSSDEDKEEEQQSQVIQGQEQGRVGVKVKETLLQDEKRPDLVLSTGSVKDSLDVTFQPPMTPIPKVDLSKVLKAQKTASTKKSEAKKRDTPRLVTSGTRRAQMDGTVLPSPLSSPITLTQPHPPSQATAARSPPSQQYLSEKARGKQRAVDPIPVDTASNHATLSPPTIVTGLHDQSTYSSTNAITDSYQSNNPLETFDKNLEEYIVFDLESPHKPREPEGDPNSAEIPVIIPGFSSPSSMRPPGDPFYSEANKNLFPTLSTSISYSSGFDSLDDFNSFEDPFVASLSNEEGAQQMATINPAFLDGSHCEDWNNGDIDVTQLEPGSGGMMTGEGIEDGESTSEEEEVRPYEEVLRVGYQPVAGSPIIASSSSSSSSLRLQSLSIPGRPGRTHLVDVTEGTLSPEFSDYYTNTQRTPGQAATSRSSSSFVPVQHKQAGPRVQPVVVSGSEAEEEEVQRDLDTLEVSSTSSDEYVGSTNSKHLPLSRPTRPGSLKRKSRKTEPPPVIAPTPAITPAKAASSVRRRGEWEHGSELSFCHQCRTKSYKLKMTCLCKKKFCNRCIALRYLSMPFRSKVDECPYCRNECSCDQCTRKRGEDYISLRVPLGEVPREHKAPIAPVAQKTRLLSKSVHLPPPEPISNVAGPFTFWGSIYDFDGNKIATAFAGPDEDNVIVANAVGGYTRSEPTEYAEEGKLPATRTFIGTCQPSWRLGRDPIIQELGKKGRPRRVDDMFQGGNHETRWFVGKECLLYRPVVVYSRDLPVSNPFSDLSSLSSLSDDSDIEVDTGILTRSQDTKIYTSGINATDSIKTAGIDGFDPNSVETRDTIRALVIALNDCGIVVKIDQSLADS